jgi:uncharacterized protein
MIEIFIKKHLLPIYFVLACAISWGGILIVVGPDGIPAALGQFDKQLPLVVLAMLAGPSIAGLSAVGIVGGRAGLRELMFRFRTWRVPLRWYAVALVTAPLVVAATLVLLSQRSPEFLPGIVTTKTPEAHLLFALVVGAGAGFFEELGWSGFAVPALRRRFSVFATGMIVGVLWGTWHLFAVWWGSSETSGGVSMWLYLPIMLFSFLPPYRILMVWVYERTQSLGIAMLMHASLTASVRLLDPIGISGLHILVYNLAIGAAFWAIVATIAFVHHRQRVNHRGVLGGTV